MRRTIMCLLAVLSVTIGCKTQAPKPPEEPKPKVEEVEYEPITEKHRALAAEAEEVLETAAGTPGQEQANFLRTRPRPKWLKQLRGEEPAPKGSLGWPIKDIRRHIEIARKGPEWPRPPLAAVPYAAEAPKIDGKLDDPVWRKAITYEKTYPFNSQEPADLQTTWKIAWDEKNLYFAFDCVDKDLVSAVRERDGRVWEDDCVEMFLLPEFRFRVYWELVIGPSGSVYDSIQCKRYYQWGSHSREAETIVGLKYGIQLRGTLNDSSDEDEGYSVEVAVPFDQLPEYSRCKPEPGDRIHFMLVRLDKTGDKMLPYAYQPLLSWGHNIWNHAVMELKK